MDALGISRVNDMFTVVKKKRSSTSRHPWPDPHLALSNCNAFFPSSAPYSDHWANLSREKKLSQNNCTSQNLMNGIGVHALTEIDGLSDDGVNDKQLLDKASAKHCNEGVSAVAQSSKRFRLKLKVGGVVQTLRQRTDLPDKSGGSYSSRETSNGLLHGRLKNLKSANDHTPEHEDEEEGTSAKGWKSSKGSKRSMTYDLGASDGLPSGSAKKSRKNSGFQADIADEDYVGGEHGCIAVSQSKRKKQESPTASHDCRLEPLTTRQRALQIGRSGGPSQIEFSNGLSFAPSRKRTDGPSEEEKLAKRAEAAQRRKMQMEKVAREAQDMAIRKIRGLDPDKNAGKPKLPTDKEKAVNSETLLPETVRLVIGPSGTIIIFPNDASLPSLFDSKPCSYPPPREKCAGPSCTNPYKYRDSRSNLPLCSLPCYRAVQGSARPLTT